MAVPIIHQLTWRGKVKDLQCQKQIHIVQDLHQSSLPPMDRMVVAAIWAVPEICRLNAKFVGIISLTLQLLETKRCTLIYLWCTGLWPGSDSVCLCKMKYCRFSSLPRCWLTWSHVGTWLRSQPYFLLRINLDTFWNTLSLFLSCSD